MEDKQLENVLEKPNDKRKVLNKLAKIIGNMVIVLLGALILLFLFFLFKNMNSSEPPIILGHQIYIVRSNSMSPTFKTGSLTLVKKVDPSLIEVNDIITYQRGENISTTHRVVEIVNDKGLQFITRGDANNTNDPAPVMAEELVGKVTLAIPFVGYLMGFARTRVGFVILMGIPGLLIIISQVIHLIRYRKIEKGKA